MKRTINYLAGTLLFVILLASLAACSSDETTTTTSTTTSSPSETTTTTTETTSTGLDEAAVRAFADDITVTTMQGLSEADEEKYTAHANDEFKTAVAALDFEAMSAQFESQIGTFISIEYQSWEELEGYIRVHYQAEYTLGTVPLLMVFDQDHLLAGQYFQY